MTDQNVFDGHALPVSDWPKRDRHAWAEAQLGDDDLLADRKPAADWRDSTKEQHSRCYGIWLAWLKSKGLLDEKTRPEERVTKARLAALRIPR